MLYLLLALISTAFAKETVPTIPAIIRSTEKKLKLPAGILSAVIKVESNGQVNAFNPNDGTRGQKAAGLNIKSHGLMQIQLAAARHMGFRGKARELMKPLVNIEYGARYLRWLLDTHSDDVAWSLTCFNAGPSSYVCRHKKYSNYVGKILNAWQQR